MFMIRFWPMTARPISAMSAVCSMILLLADGVQPDQTFRGRLREPGRHSRRSPANRRFTGNSSTIPDNNPSYNMRLGSVQTGRGTEGAKGAAGQRRARGEGGAAGAAGAG